MLELTDTLVNSEAILNYSFTPHCENNEMVKAKDANVEDEDEVLQTTSTELHNDILTRFDFTNRVTYTYKTYYGPWFGLCSTLINWVLKIMAK